MKKANLKDAQPGSASHKKGWTPSGISDLYYRHDSKGALCLGTRVYRDGKNRFVNLHTDSVAVAKRKLAPARDENLKKPSARSIPTVRQYFEDRVKPLVEAGPQRRSTKDTYLRCVGQILDGYHGSDLATKLDEQGKAVRVGDGACPKAILDKPVDKLTEEDCEKWFNAAFLRPYSLSAISDQWIQWRTLFKAARRDSLIFALPEWKVPKSVAQGRERSYKVQVLGQSTQLTILDRHQFLAVIEEIRNGGSRLAEDSANWALLLACSGLRKGELKLLRWRDIDWDRAIAHLPGRLKSNGKGTPQIDLNEWALGALRRIRKSGWTREVVKGANLSVFRGEDALRDSDFVSPFVTAEEAVERACERLGFEKQSPHKLRSNNAR